MVRSLEELTQEAVKLPKNQRLTLTRVLLDLDKPASSESSDETWGKEIEDRIRAVDEGLAETVEYEELRKEMSARFPA